jgi:hypothetical protein
MFKLAEFITFDIESISVVAAIRSSSVSRIKLP